MLLFASLGKASAEESASQGPTVVKLQRPVPYQVIQREGFVPARAHSHQAGGPELGFGAVPIAGKFPANATSLDYRIVPQEKNGGVSTDWKPVDGKLEKGEFQGSARVPAGGWYRLEVRARNAEKMIATASVEPVGVGEVFVVAGQSYATNCNDEKLKVADPTGRVVVFDLVDKWRVAHDPQPAPDGSHDGSIWPAFGDALLPGVRVPIGLVNVAWGGTSTDQWMPDKELHKRLCAVAGQVGRFRAVLWQQGESDVIAKTTKDKYVANVRAIREAAAKAWGFDPPWLLAKSTLHPMVYNNPTGEGRIRDAIDELCRLPGFHHGPDTDVLDGANRGGEGSRRHFSGRGQRAAALLWFAAVWNELNSVPTKEVAR